jgi:hypothetical protein
VRQTGKVAPSKEVIDRHNKHSKETYPEVVKKKSF